jgi:hypothetical protein
MSTYGLEEVERKLKELWQAQPSTKSFFIKLRMIIKFYKNFCKNKAREFWAKHLQVGGLEKARAKHLQVVRLEKFEQNPKPYKANLDL